VVVLVVSRSHGGFEALFVRPGETPRYMDIEREDVVEAAAAAVPVLILIGALVAVGATFVTETPADYGVTVSVTDDGSPAANATVGVSADVAYEGTGEYTVPENGTLSLASPGEMTNVSVGATLGDRTAVREATLVPNGSDQAPAIGNGTDDGGLSVGIEQDTDSTEKLSETGGQAIVGVLVAFVLLMSIVGIRLGGDD
jgi:hypothetical protein